MSLAYQYFVLRYVPVVEREEFLNVGVVISTAQPAFLDLGYHASPERLQAFSPAAEPADLLDQLRTMQQFCRGEELPGVPALSRTGQRFGWLAAPRSTVLQPGPVHGGVCTDPSAELKRLLVRLVSRT